MTQMTTKSVVLPLETRSERSRTKLESILFTFPAVFVYGNCSRLVTGILRLSSWKTAQIRPLCFMADFAGHHPSHETQENEFLPGQRSISGLLSVLRISDSAITTPTTAPLASRRIRAATGSATPP